MPVTPAQLQHAVDTFDWDAWSKKVSGAIGADYRAIADAQAQREADALGLDWNPDDPFVDEWFTGYLAERVTQISDTTRDVLRAELQRAIADAEGESMTALADALRAAVADSAAFSPARALTIARTETAFAYNHGALLAFSQNGIDRVEVSDGDGDEECADADGQIWTIEEAMANPIAHPNCVRSFSPVLDDEDQATDEE